MGAITHSTPADGSFSPAGAAAWDAEHNVAIEAADIQDAGPTGIALIQAPSPDVAKALLGVADGLDGLDGIDGPPGPVGPAGPPGVAGARGLVGADGLDGQDGLPGAVGPQGPQGIQGPAGGGSASAGSPGLDGQDGDDAFFAAPLPPVYDPPQGSFAPGSFSVATGRYAVMSGFLQLTGSQYATLHGTAQLRIT